MAGNLPIKILCVVISLPEDLHPRTIPSVQLQTVAPEKVLVANERVKGETMSQMPNRIATAFNRAIEDEDLNKYDYVLRLDGDVVLPPNFVEENLKADADVIGTCAYAMLIRTAPFVQAMNGRLSHENDDAYLRAKLQSCGCRIAQLLVKPTLTRKCGDTHGLAYFIFRGRQMRRLGYEPVHMLFTAFHERDGRNFLVFIGYMLDWLQHARKYDVADYVRSYQIHRLASGLRWKYD